MSWWRRSVAGAVFLRIKLEKNLKFKTHNWEFKMQVGEWARNDNDGHFDDCTFVGDEDRWLNEYEDYHDHNSAKIQTRKDEFPNLRWAR